MLTLTSPPGLGLPCKFPAWRPLQIRAVGDGAQSAKRFVAQCLATGSGKSLSNVMQGMLAGRAVYLTGTRALQKQLFDDFEETGMADVKGRGNYTCTYGASGNVTCDDGMHLGCRAHKEGACDYANTLGAARGSALVDTNYHYWMSVNKYGEGLGDVDLLVCDEADAAVDAICGMMTVELTSRELRAVKLGAPTDTTDVMAWRGWAAVAVKQIETQQEQEAAVLKRNPGNADALRNLKQTRALRQKLDTLAQSTGEWVADAAYEDRGDAVSRSGYRFDPVWPAEYAEDLLFCGVPRVLLTSATLNRKTCRLLGIPDADLDYFDYPGVFDPRRSPVTWVRSGARVDQGMSDDAVRSWIARIDQILRSRPRMKGIIHCRSYPRQKDIYRLSGERHRFIWHNAWNTQEKIAEFKQSAPELGKVLLSPAVTTGYNFPDDECRFNILAKIPMSDTRSRIMRARLKEDRDYADHLAAQVVEQTCGRPVRSDTDWCQNFVVDDHWAWWYPKMCKKGLFTKSFMQRVTRVSEGIPEVLY